MITVIQARDILRVSTDQTDAEIALILNAAEEHLKSMGVAVSIHANNPLLNRAIVCYLKWQYGFSDEAERWKDYYYEAVGELKLLSEYRECDG